MTKVAYFFNMLYYLQAFFTSHYHYSIYLIFEKENSIEDNLSISLSLFYKTLHTHVCTPLRETISNSSKKMASIYFSFFSVYYILFFFDFLMLLQPPQMTRKELIVPPLSLQGMELKVGYRLFTSNQHLLSN